MRYRRDIDGLRAVAVLSVVFYHADFPFVRGGYVGVDVFFVISGFLITSIIMADLDAGRFSLGHFYQRRLLRLIPALIVVLAATLGGGWLLLGPDPYVDLALSAVAALTFVSNIWFWRTLHDYFASAAEFSPLLHTWSLAVEEQFYLIYPLLLLAVVRWLGRPALWVAAAAAASFALSLWGMAEHPYATFYLTPTRAWELGLGALTAFAARGGLTPTARLLREGMALLGLALISWTIVSYTSATPFPGVTALPPVVGTALLIWSGAAGTPTIVARALSLPPIVWIGAISYSLYLWHWPILAYLRIATGFTILDRPVALAAIAVSVALAYATLRLVEQPLRYGRAPAMPRSVATGAAATGLVAFGLFVWAVDGVPMRLSPAAARIAAATEDRTELPIECWDFGPVALSDECRIGADAAQDGRIDFVFWGDSHALAIKPAIDELARASGRSGLFAGRGACPPMDGVVRLNEYVNRTCAAFQNVVLEALDRRDDIDTVILHARWARMAEGRGAGYYRGSFLLLGDEVTHSRQPQENFNIFARGLERTVQRIAATGRRVVVIGATPEVGWHVPNVLFSAERLQLAPPDPLMAEDVRQRNSRVTALMTALNDEGLIHAIFDVTPRFCDPTCALTVEGRPTFFDGHHLTRSAALELLAGHPELGPLPLFERVPDRN